MWVSFSFQVARRPVHPPWPAPAAGAQVPPVDAHAHAHDDSDDDVAPPEALPEGLNGDLVDEAPEQEPVPTARKKRIVAELHSQLAAHFPDHFHHVEEAVPYYEIKSDPAAPLLIIDPDFSRSWLRPPVPKPDDTFGYWPAKNCKLPPTRRTLFPPTTKAKPLGRAPYYHVADDTLRKTLDSTVQMDKVHLDLKVFDVADVSIRNAPQAALDVHLRRATLETFTTDAYLQLLFELSECISGASQTVSQLRAIELLPGVVRQAAMANARTGQSLSAGYVGNIVNLRDAVLGRFTVPKRTQEILRGWRLHW